MNMRPPGCSKPRSSTFSTRMPRLTLARMGFKLRVEGFFGDGEVGEPHRDHAALAPDEQRQRLLQRNDFQRAGVGHAVIGQQRLDRGIDQHLQLRQLRMQAELRRLIGNCVGKFELIGGVEFGFELDGLDRRPAQPQRVHAHAILPARHGLDLQRAAEASRGCTAAQ